MKGLLEFTMNQAKRDRSIIRETLYLIALVSALLALAVAGGCLLLADSIPANEGINIATMVAAFFAVIGFVLSVAAMCLSYSWLTLTGALLTFYANCIVQSLAIA